MEQDKGYNTVEAAIISVCALGKSSYFMEEEIIKLYSKIAQLLKKIG